MVKRMTTKDFLFESFKELAKEKQLDDISINDIVENSQISRATFYRYFRDKFDLMEQYYQHEIEMIADDFYESDNLKKCRKTLMNLFLKIWSCSKILENMKDKIIFSISYICTVLICISARLKNTIRAKISQKNFSSLFSITLPAV